jgi:hypothetical protein
MSAPTFLHLTTPAPLSLARIAVAVPAQEAHQPPNAPPALAPADAAAPAVDTLLAGDAVAVPVGHDTLHVFCHKVRGREAGTEGRKWGGGGRGAPTTLFRL